MSSLGEQLLGSIAGLQPNKAGLSWHWKAELAVQGVEYQLAGSFVAINHTRCGCLGTGCLAGNLRFFSMFQEPQGLLQLPLCCKAAEDGPDIQGCIDGQHCFSQSLANKRYLPAFMWGFLQIKNIFNVRTYILPSRATILAPSEG